MPKFKSAGMPVKYRRELENLRASVAQQEAYNDYVAMMCGVELPGENSEVQDEEQDEEQN